MRVISGTAKGFKLFTPNGVHIRPTTDMVKESLFNMLSDITDIRGSTFLDLFAGTGSIGIEALSRGANHAVFIDSSEKSVILVKKNLEKTHLSNKSEVFLCDVLNGLAWLSKRQVSFDFIFIDPPYGQKSDFLASVFSIIAKNSLLTKSGICILEQQSKEVVSDFSEQGFLNIKTKVYSNAKLTFWKCAENNS